MLGALHRSYDLKQGAGQVSRNRLRYPLPIIIPMVDMKPSTT
jgi:hypothetical protein